MPRARGNISSEDDPQLQVLFKEGVRHRRNGRLDAALNAMREATTLIRKQYVADRNQAFWASIDEPRLSPLHAEVLALHLAIVANILDGQHHQAYDLIDESFRIAQLLRPTSAGLAYERMEARSGKWRELGVARTHQDSVEELHRVNRALAEKQYLPSDEESHRRKERLLARKMWLTRMIRGSYGSVALKNSDYPREENWVSLSKIQSILLPGEALLAYLIEKERVFLWVIRDTNSRFINLSISRSSVGSAVNKLRAALDLRRPRARDLLKFPATTAHSLYKDVFAPARLMLHGVHHILLVLDRPLSSLPMGVLITKPPRRVFHHLREYREVRWLMRDYAFSVLPGPLALRMLREGTRTPASEPAAGKTSFVGIGDPVIGARPRGNWWTSIDALLHTIGIRSPSNWWTNLDTLLRTGGLADPERLRELPALPETSEELMAMARLLGNGNENVFVRERANETWIKGRQRYLDKARLNASPLAKYDILAFATHALLAGDGDGGYKPGIVLTPPRHGSRQDDGLLTASEIMRLELNADWVILSACNTAARGERGSEPLSGLAKAFVYAGSRTLLVSHWRVASKATVELTVGTLSILRQLPEIGRSEAHRRAMLKLLYDRGHEVYAHPRFWAAFVIVGDGGSV